MTTQTRIGQAAPALRFISLWYTPPLVPKPCLKCTETHREMYRNLCSHAFALSVLTMTGFRERPFTQGLTDCTET